MIRDAATINRALALAAGAVRLIAATTPDNAASERERVTSAVAAGTLVTPTLRYCAPRPELRELGGWLRDIAAAVRTALPADLRDLYLARIDEVDLEARIAIAAGTAALGPLAAARFGPVTDQRIAARWAGATATDDDDEERIATDSGDPRSLLTLMRRRVQELELDFDVVVHASLSALAATGDHHIYVAPGRHVSLRVAQRTTLHETLAHAVPRQRARSAPLALLAIGTAGGHDDQEGLALWLEQRHGFLDAARKRELGARHLSVARMRSGASFVEVTRALLAGGFTPGDAVTITLRVFRGGDGTCAGLGREGVYLPAFRRVRAALKTSPGLLDILSSGQVSCDAAETLARAAH